MGLATIKTVFKHWQLPVCAQSTMEISGAHAIVDVRCANRVRAALPALLDRLLDDIDWAARKTAGEFKKLVASTVSWGDTILLANIWKKGVSQFFDGPSKSAGRTAPYAPVWGCFVAELLLCVLSVWMAGDGAKLQAPHRDMFELLSRTGLQAQASYAPLAL